ncbi:MULTISPECIES: hypothetical protein [Spirulina sp. CCY15215]|uniref:tetratricopeptide repeat protein n=1 Tax=Spirulina sp. CCY15215 TaxID=2767591 RepID=UPI00195280F5|nr:hypothetical protein [Spirulina major]
MAVIDDAIAAYETALVALENASPDPSFEQIVATLIARDGVEKKRQMDQAPAGETYAKLISLDERLKAQREHIVRDGNLEEWKTSVNALPAQWWWNLNDLDPLFNKAIARYDRALSMIKDSRSPEEEELLEALLARDEVEDAIAASFQNQPVPEKLAKKLIDLDRQLKRHRLALNFNNQLSQWKRSLKRENSWWWNLKPELLGSEEDPPSPRDWVITGLAIGALGIAASFILSTAQTFSKEVEGVQTDAAQNLATVLQVVGLGTAGAGALTKKGQETIEKMVTVLRLPSNLHAPAALGIAGGLMTVTGLINASLPAWGGWYIAQGQNFEKNNELIKARDSYLQASKFVRSADDQAKLTLGLGKINERLGRYDKAEQEYEKARLLNDPTAMNALGRILLIQELSQQGQLALPKKVVINAESLFGRAQETLLLEQSKIENLITNDPEKALIYIDTQINKGILEWFKVKWPRQPGLPLLSAAPASGIVPQAVAVEPVPQGSSDPVQFTRDNEENFFSALANNNEAVVYLQALRDQHGDRKDIAAKIDELETRALCLRDSAALVTIALGLQQFSQEESSGVYHCVADANPSRYVVSPEDTLIIQTVRDALPVTKEDIYNAFRNLTQGYQP